MSVAWGSDHKAAKDQSAPASSPDQSRATSLAGLESQRASASLSRTCTSSTGRSMHLPSTSSLPAHHHRHDPFSRAAGSHASLMADAPGSQCAEHGDWSGDHQAVWGSTSLRCLSRIDECVARHITHELPRKITRGWNEEKSFPSHQLALVLARGKCGRQMDRHHVRRWGSCSTRWTPSVHA